MSEEEEPDLELFGTSPGVIAFFMILITLIAPLGVIPFGGFIAFGGGYGSYEFTIYSIIWSYSPGMFLDISMIPLFILANIWITLPFTLFNIAYVWKIIRYFRGNCTRFSVIWVGMLSLIFPTLFAIFSGGTIDPADGFVFIGSIPIQFIAGLIFMFKLEGPEMTSPWRGDLGDRSWWKPKRPDWWTRMFPSSEKDEDKETVFDSEPERLETE